MNNVSAMEDAQASLGKNGRMEATEESSLGLLLVGVVEVLGALLRGVAVQV